MASVNAISGGQLGLRLMKTHSKLSWVSGGGPPPHIANSKTGGTAVMRPGT